MKILAVTRTWRQFGRKSWRQYNLCKSVVQHVNKQTFSNPPMKNCRTFGTLQNKTDSFMGIPNSPDSWKMLTASQNVYVTDVRNYVSYSKHFQKIEPIQKYSSSMCCKSNTPQNIQNLEPLLSTSLRFSSSSAPHYEPCYIFKYIVHTRVLSRLKIYQTAATITLIPPAVYLNNVGLLPTVEMYTMFGITSVACIMLYVMSLYFRSIVGMISVCKENRTVRLSHLTFWGKRNDIYLSPEDIVPLMDMSENMRNVYAVLKTYSSDKTFIIFLRYFRRLDKEQLEEILGRLE